MAIIEHDWVWETATVSGTGSVTLPGTPAQTGARTFVSVYANNDQCPYVIADNTTGASESGIGTITVSGTVATLARTVVIESTNSNTLVDFAGNACGVFVTKAPGVQTSAGAADAGKVPVLGSAGQLDSSMLPASGWLYGYGVAGSPFIVNDTIWRGTDANTWASGTLLRFAVAWKYPFSPSLIGVLPGSSVSGAICRIGIYPIVSTGEAGTLLFDSGDISPTSVNVAAFGSNTFSGTLSPGTYLFDLLIGSTAPNLLVEGDFAQSPAATPAAFFGGPTGLYYQYPALVWTQTGVTYGAMPTTAPANSTFSGQNSAGASGNRPIIVAQR